MKPNATLLMANDLLANMVIDVENGHTDPLEAYVAFAKTVKALEAYMEQLRPQAVAELAKYGKEGRKVLGFSAKPKEAVSYTYEYPTPLAENMAMVAEHKKKYEAMTKLATTPYMLVDPETGEEVFEIRPAIKKSTSTIQVS